LVEDHEVDVLNDIGSVDLVVVWVFSVCFLEQKGQVFKLRAV
jgi:hypothetical protein